MAKEKKSEPKKSEKAAEKPAAKTAAKKTTAAAPAPAAKKAAPKKAQPAVSGAPLIDTSFAASAAAKMLAAGANKPATTTPHTPRGESAMFKSLKAGINKPGTGAMSNLLEKSHGPQPVKSHASFNKQVGHNQTFGADVTRSGVPRRNPG